MGNAIGQEGVANTEYLAAAPYQQILQELANETAYKAASNTGAAAFGGNAQTTPAFLQQIFKNLGLGSVPGAAGTPTLPGAPKAATGGTTGTTPATSGSSNPSAP